MGQVEIAKDKYLKMAEKNFSKIQIRPAEITIYTIIYVALSAAANYSRTVTWLNTEAIKSLVLASIIDCVDHLFIINMIDANVRQRLILQYDKDSKDSIPNSLTEMILMSSISEESSDNKKSRCNLL